MRPRSFVAVRLPGCQFRDLVRWLRVAVALAMIIAALLPWHRFNSGSLHGGLGPDNHIAVLHGETEVHRGTERGLATLGGPIIMLAVLASERRIDKRLRRRWARVLWSVFC